MCRQIEYYHTLGRGKDRVEYRITIGGGGLYFGLAKWYKAREVGGNGEWFDVLFIQGEDAGRVADKYYELGWRGFAKWWDMGGYPWEPE